MTPPISRNKVAKEFDAYSKTYNETVNQALTLPLMDVDYFTRVKAGFLIDHLQKHFKATENLSILDMGCGIGNYHRILEPLVKRLIGVDLSEASIVRAREINPKCEYYTSLHNEREITDDSIDCVFAICVLHHVPLSERDAFMSKIFALLRKGGLAMIFEHNPINPLTMRVVNNCLFDKDAILLSMAEACQYFSKAGFSKIRAQSILSIPSFGKITRRIDYALGCLGIGAQYLVKGQK